MKVLVLEQHFSMQETRASRSSASARAPSTGGTERTNLTTVGDSGSPSPSRSTSATCPRARVRLDVRGRRAASGRDLGERGLDVVPGDRRGADNAAPVLARDAQGAERVWVLVADKGRVHHHLAITWPLRGEGAAGARRGRGRDLVAHTEARVVGL